MPLALKLALVVIGAAVAAGVVTQRVCDAVRATPALPEPASSRSTTPPPVASPSPTAEPRTTPTPVVTPTAEPASVYEPPRKLRRLRNPEVTAEIGAAAKRILAKHHLEPYGTEIPFRADGKEYVGRIERHYHPPGGQARPWGYHPGVSVFAVVDAAPRASKGLTRALGRF